MNALQDKKNHTKIPPYIYFLMYFVMNWVYIFLKSWNDYMLLLMFIQRSRKRPLDIDCRIIDVWTRWSVDVWMCGSTELFINVIVTKIKIK